MIMAVFNVSGSITDIFSFAAELWIMAWFFRDVRPDIERRHRSRWNAAGCVALLLLLFLYMTPLNAAVNVLSLVNLIKQFVRMLVHLVPVAIWLSAAKGCRMRRAVYLSAIFTAIFLTSQNVRMVVMTNTLGSISAVGTKGPLYVAGVVVIALVELLLAWMTKKLILPEEIDLIDKQRVGLMVIVLFMTVYFKWLLIAVREQNMVVNRLVMISFSLMASLGMYAVLLLYEYSRLLLKGKEDAEHEKLVLRYEVRSAKREMQSSDDIRRLYHDIKNHLLAIQNMAGDESEINDYLSDLLPKFQGYETQVKTGDPVVDAILSEKIQLAYPDGIRFNICLDLSKIKEIKSVDLVTIFGNAVDNAIEALRRIDDDQEKYVYIKSKSFAGNTVIRFQNAFRGEITMEGGHPVTSKRDGDLHGIGISSIKNAVSRYGGTARVKFDNEKHEFTLVVMIPEAPSAD